MNVIAIIPARLASSRLPEKPLARLNGLTMIEHVFRRTQLVPSVTAVYIATCDGRIADEAASFGAPVIMTSPHHVRGTDRVAEAAATVEADIVVNVQGDEPLLVPGGIEAAIDSMRQDPSVEAVNLIAPITDPQVLGDPNVVKAVIDQDHTVLYLSRQPIPSGQAPCQAAYKQIGIYLFRAAFLAAFAAWPQTPLETVERVDMLRILERGGTLRACITADMFSVDTPQDLAIAASLLAQDPYVARYRT